MKNEIFTVYTREELKELFLESLVEYNKIKLESESLDVTYSINQVRKKLNRSHATIKNLIKSGLIATTKDQRRVPAWALREYLLKIPNK